MNVQAIPTQKWAENLSFAEVVTFDLEQANKLFNYLRWPKSNGQPHCPYCDKKLSKDYITKIKYVYYHYYCNPCHKGFSASTRTALEGSTSSKIKQLSLIYAAREKVLIRKISTTIGVRWETAHRWVNRINAEFKGNLFFPPPRPKKNRTTIDQKKAKIILYLKKPQMAEFLLNHKKATRTQMLQYFNEYDEFTTDSSWRDLSTKTKAYLKLIANGESPSEEAQKKILQIKRSI